MKNLIFYGLALFNQRYRISLVPTSGNFEPIVLESINVNVSETTPIDTVYFKN